MKWAHLSVGTMDCWWDSLNKTTIPISSDAKKSFNNILVDTIKLTSVGLTVPDEGSEDVGWAVEGFAKRDPRDKSGRLE